MTNPSHNDNLDLSGLLVTLRHGLPGMKAATDYTRNWLYSPRKDSAGRSLFSLLPSALNKLLDTIRMRFAVESPQVQNSLRKLLDGLKENCAPNGIDQPGHPIKSPEQFRFVVQRVLGLVNGATASLA